MYIFYSTNEIAILQYCSFGVQGNGHERDFVNNANIFIMDVYNADIYPRDKDARRKQLLIMTVAQRKVTKNLNYNRFLGGINKEIRIRSGERDDRYLKFIKLLVSFALVLITILIAK